MVDKGREKREKVVKKEEKRERRERGDGEVVRGGQGWWWKCEW